MGIVHVSGTPKELATNICSYPKNPIPNDVLPGVTDTHGVRKNDTCVTPSDVYTEEEGALKMYATGYAHLPKLESKSDPNTEMEYMNT